MDIVPTIADKRPPFVRFEMREYGAQDMPNPDGPELPKISVPKMTAFVCVTSHGSKDSFEAPAESWLADKLNKAKKGEYPYEWYNHFKLAYAEWLKGNELPRLGTPIATWMMLPAKSVRDRIISVGIATVEDLGAMPDSGLAQIGLDGRYLRDMAATWCAEAKDKGATAKELADVKAENQRLTAQNEELSNRFAAMERRLDKFMREQDEDEEPAPRRRRRAAAEPEGAGGIMSEQGAG
jgi:hypothetical protein